MSIVCSIVSIVCSHELRTRINLVLSSCTCTRLSLPQTFLLLYHMLDLHAMSRRVPEPCAQCSSWLLPTLHAAEIRDGQGVALLPPVTTLAQFDWYPAHGLGNYSTV